MTVEHCRHCWSGCAGRGGEYGHGAMFHADYDGAMWDHGRCPACAEGERVEAALLDEYDEHEDIAVLAALRIVRGEA